MTVGRLISELQEHWNLDGEIIVKMQGHIDDTSTLASGAYREFAEEFYKLGLEHGKSGLG